MSPEALKELFKPFGEVSVKRMFGGAGVYAEGRDRAGRRSLSQSQRRLLAGFCRRGLFTLHLRRPRQTDADVLLALARDCPGRGRRAHPLDVAWPRRGPSRGRRQGEAEESIKSQEGPSLDLRERQHCDDVHDRRRIDQESPAHPRLQPIQESVAGDLILALVEPARERGAEDRAGGAGSACRQSPNVAIFAVLGPSGVLDGREAAFEKAKSESQIAAGKGRKPLPQS
jgi:hypothetical protein